MKRFASLKEIAPDTYVVEKVFKSAEKKLGSVEFPTGILNPYRFLQREPEGMLYNPFIFEALLKGEKPRFKLSVILVHYDRQKDLEVCLKHLEDQTLSKSEYEVIVADDGTKGGVEEILECCTLNLKLVTNPRSDFEEFRNPATVKNMALAKAEGEFAMVKSAELLPCKKITLETILRIHEQGFRRVRCPLARLNEEVSWRIRDDSGESLEEIYREAIVDSPLRHIKTFSLLDALWIGGISQCFKGYGGEDSDFTHRMKRIVGDEAVFLENDAHYIHLWHPMVRPKWMENQSVFEKIRGHLKATHQEVGP